MFEDAKAFVSAAETRRDVQDGKAAAISLKRLEAAKRSFTTRRVDLGNARRLVCQGAPKPGDLVLARVTALGQHQKLESPAGRRAKLYIGDEIIVAYGARYAPDQFESVVPDDLAECDLVAGGGVASRVIGRHGSMRPATRIEPLGLLSDAEGKALNLSDFALPHRVLDTARPTVIAIAGSSMNAGKTTVAAGLIHGLAGAGLNVAATKVTGTGSGGDLWSMLDAGAHDVLDFTDLGHASTAGLPAAAAEQVALSLIAHLAAKAPDIIIVEIADGVLQKETAALLSSPALREAIDGVLFAAGDALSAMGGYTWLRDHGHRVIGVSGLVSASPLASREATAGMGIPILTLATLSDPATAPKICFTTHSNDTTASQRA